MKQFIILTIVPLAASTFGFGSCEESMQCKVPDFQLDVDRFLG